MSCIRAGCVTCGTVLRCDRRGQGQLRGFGRGRDVRGWSETLSNCQEVHDSDHRHLTGVELRRQRVQRLVTSALPLMEDFVCRAEVAQRSVDRLLATQMLLSHAVAFQFVIHSALLVGMLVRAG